MNIESVEAKDIMKKKVIKVTRETTLKDLAKLFESEHISGAPVVEDNDKLIGVVSGTDLVRFNATHERVTAAHESGGEEMAAYFQEDDENSAGSHSGEEVFSGGTSDDLESKTVEDIMTPWTISVRQNTPVIEIAKMMTERHIHRVFVTDDRSRLKGIVTTMDIVGLIAGAYGRQEK